MEAKAEKLALFRYGLIASLVIERLPRGELTRCAQEIPLPAPSSIPIPNGPGFASIPWLDWALRYPNGGFEAMAPNPRQDRGQSRAVTPQAWPASSNACKRENPHRTGTTLLRELALSSGQDSPALLGFYTLPLPQTTRSVRKTTAGTTGAQEDLRGRCRCLGLRPAVATCSRPSTLFARTSSADRP